jgi:PleD family two-component response regulator
VQASDKDEETLFQRVDNAVYEAKRTGRNKVATEMDVQGNQGAKTAAA